MNYQRLILVSVLVFITVAVCVVTLHQQDLWQTNSYETPACPPQIIQPIEIPSDRNSESNHLESNTGNPQTTDHRPTRKHTYRFGEFKANISSPEYEAGVLNDNFVKFRGVWMRNDEMIHWLTSAQGELEVYKIFSETVVKCPAEGGIVLDIGSNTGFYGMMSAIHGCEVYFFDPQPWCQHFLGLSVVMNEITNRTYMVPHGVANLTIEIPIMRNVKCAGTMKSGLYEGWKENPIAGPPAQQVPGTTITVRIDDLFNENDLIRIMKVDTEGAELGILQSAYNLLKKHRIRELIVEFTPPYWAPTGFTKDHAATILKDIWDFGYNARNYYVYDGTGAYQNFTTSESLVAWAAYHPYLQTDIHFTLDSSRGAEWGKP